MLGIVCLWQVFLRWCYRENACLGILGACFVLQKPLEDSYVWTKAHTILLPPSHPHTHSLFSLHEIGKSWKHTTPPPKKLAGQAHTEKHVIFYSKMLSIILSVNYNILSYCNVPIREENMWKKIYQTLTTWMMNNDWRQILLHDHGQEWNAINYYTPQILYQEYSSHMTTSFPSKNFFSKCYRTKVLIYCYCLSKF